VFTILFGEEYYKERYCYAGRKAASRKAELESWYAIVLGWANHQSNWNLFQGDGRYAIDIGSGFGFVSAMFSSFGYQSFGVDISLTAISLARQRCGKEDPMFIACSAEQALPFKAKFDLVTCFEALEHMHSPFSSLRNIYNALKPNGVLVATSPNRFALYSKIWDRDRTHISIENIWKWKNWVLTFPDLRNSRVECFVPLLPFTVSRRHLLKSIPLIGNQCRIFLQKTL
jgi:SAM-dependent methyltransferase